MQIFEILLTLRRDSTIIIIIVKSEITLGMYITVANINLMNN